MNRKIIVLSFIVINALSIQLLFAAELKGARYLIDLINSKQAEEKKETPLEAWKREVTAYKMGLSGLSDDQAVERWLSLYNRMWELDISESNYYRNGLENNLKEIIKVIPPTKTWNLLHKKGEEVKSSKKISDLCLRYITHFLNKDSDGMLTVLKEMETIAGDLPDYKKQSAKTAINRAAQTLNEIVGSAEDQVKGFLNDQLPGNSDYLKILDVPDLVTIVGKEKARAYLKDALFRENVMLEVKTGDETRKLARELALEMLSKLKTPQWKLAAAVDAMGLYEALQNKFPNVDKSDNTTDTGILGLLKDTSVKKIYKFNESMESYELEARVYYMIALIVNNRQAEAKKIASSIGFEENTDFAKSIISDLNDKGYGKELQSFLFNLLKENPESNLWEYYIPVAAQTSKTEELIALLKNSANKTELKKMSGIRLRKYLFKAYLSLNQLDQAWEIVNEIDYHGGDLNSVECLGIQEEIEDIGESMVKAGNLLKNEKWIDKGMLLLKESLNNRKPKRNEFSYPEHRMVSSLIELESYQPAEDLLINSILKKVFGENKKPAIYEWNLCEIQLHDLIYIYYKSKHYRDMVTLLDEYPYWNKKDLKEMLSDSSSVREENLGHMLARALYDQGKKDEAVTAAKITLGKNAGYDPSYELLVEALGAKLIPLLDAKYKLDPFEERPLIWKAVLLLKEGNYDAAEEAAKLAITIDPTDGEQPFGRRLLGYSVMADIKAARGDEKQRDFYKNIVAAVKLSEKADKFYKAGLIKKSADLYSESLGMFSDAYCIQGRLAMRLEELGKYEEAEKHYLKTYELMPGSFGRMESYCFGCENIFGTSLRKKLAERAFKAYLEKHPDKPQAYYMLGSLKMEQGNVKEAADLFNKAVSLDPLYINAWKKLNELSDSIYLPFTERDKIALALLKLDPASKHTSSVANKIWDIMAMWNILTEYDLPPEESTKDKDIYPLAVSAKVTREAKDKLGWDNWNEHPSDSNSSDPGTVLSQHELMTNFYSLVSSFIFEYTPQND